MPVKRPAGFQPGKNNQQEKQPFESLTTEDKLLAKKGNGIGVVIHPEKKDTEQEKKHIPAFQLKPDKIMHENIEAIKELLGTNNKTQIVKQAVAWYRKKLEKELL